MDKVFNNKFLTDKRIDKKYISAIVLVQIYLYIDGRVPLTMIGPTAHFNRPMKLPEV